jgi:hypothetical protein
MGCFLCRRTYVQGKVLGYQAPPENLVFHGAKLPVHIVLALTDGSIVVAKSFTLTCDRVKRWTGKAGTGMYLLFTFIDTWVCSQDYA